MVSTRGVRYKFSEGERVLCYEPDPTKAKVLYDSKVLEVIENKDKRGRRTIEYLIHFQGWNSSWDRCVGEDFVLKDTEENRQLQRDLAEKSQLQLGAYLYRRERKKGSTTGAAGSSAAKRSRHRFSDDGSSSSTQPDEQENEEAGDAEPEADGENSQESPEEEIKQEMESDSSESSEDEPRAHASASNHVPAPVGRAHLTLPPVLRDRLTFDYHLIVKRNRLTRLPASPCAAQILESFVKWFARAGAWHTPRGRNEPPQKPDLADVSRRLNLVREVADGIRVYFDFIMRGNLLYKPELAQYHQVCGQFLDQQERKMKEELESDGLSQDEYDDDAASAEEDIKSPKIPEYSHLPPDPVQAPEVQENGDMMDVIDIKQEIKEEPEDAEEMQEDAEEMQEEMDAQLQEEMQEAMRREMQGDLPEGEVMQQQIKEEIEDQEDYQEEAQEDYQEESQDGMQEEMQEAHEEIQEEESQQELIRVVKHEIEKVIEEVVREEVIEEMLDEKEKVKKELIEVKYHISEEKYGTKDDKQDIKAIKDEKIDEEVPVKIKQEKEDSNDAQNCQSAMEFTKQTSEPQINEKIDTLNDSMEETNPDTEDATKEVKVTESQSQETLCSKSESHHREALRSHALEGRDGLRSHTTESNGKSTESSGKSTENHGQVSESRGQVSESHNQNSESHGQNSEDHSQNSEDHHQEGHSQVSEGNQMVENRRQTTEGHSRELRSQVSESHSREGLRSHTSESHHIREGLRSQSMEGHHSPRSPAVEDTFANTVRRELRPNTRSRRANNSPAVGINSPAVSNSSPAIGNNPPAVGSNSPAVGSNSPAFERGNSSPGAHRGNNSPSVQRGNNSPSVQRGNNSPNVQRGNNSPSVQRGNNSPGVQRGNNSPAKEDVPDQVTAEDPHSFANTVRNQINRPATRGQRRRWNNSPATPAMHEEGHSSGCAPEAPLISEIKQEPVDSRPAICTRTRSGNRKSINSPAVAPAANSPAVDSPAVDSAAVNSSEEATGSHEGHPVEIKQERDAETIRPATRSGNVARRLRSHKSAVSQSENEEPQPSTSTAEPRHFEHSSSVGSGSGSSNEEWPKPAEPAPSPASSTRTPLSLLLEKVSQYEIIPREGTEHLPCRVYGAIHLARLFVRLPDFLNATQMSDFKLKLVVKHIDMFIQYLVEHKEWFGEKYYYCDSMSRST